MCQKTVGVHIADSTFSPPARDRDLLEAFFIFTFTFSSLAAGFFFFSFFIFFFQPRTHVADYYPTIELTMVSLF